MAKVKFTETVTTRETVPQRFEAGEVYDLPELSANRWVIRGKAERVFESAPLKAVATEPPIKPQASGAPARTKGVPGTPGGAEVRPPAVTAPDPAVDPAADGTAVEDIPSDAPPADPAVVPVVADKVEPAVRVAPKPKGK